VIENGDFWYSATPDVSGKGGMPLAAMYLFLGKI
jgi:hypothetical protein